MNEKRRLVFISACRQDREWRELLKKKLAAHENVEWWDDSRLKAGDNWPAEIEAAVTRADIATVLLSNEYIASQHAPEEFARLMERSRRNQMKLFPVLLRQCEWRRLPFLAETFIWANATPVLERDSPPEKEFEEIAFAIANLDLASETASPSQSSGTSFQFSTSATGILHRARELAKTSKRTGVTSSCLLFAFSESANSNLHDTAWFLRQAMQSEGRYDKARKEFLSDSDQSPAQSVIDAGELLGRASANVTQVLTHASEIAAQVSELGPAVIHQRHLLAALLTAPSSGLRPMAWSRLQGVGLELASLRREFRDFLRTVDLVENEEAWDAILLPQTTFTPKPPPPSERRVPPPSFQAADGEYMPGPAGHSSEFCAVGLRPLPDHLFVDELANRLAELIALRETPLPLAVGLFGNWGSGKSHFMNLIDLRLKALAKETTQTSDGSESSWCREIVPVYFNAWHYLDTNLWASLISQIFDSLFAHLRPKENELEKVEKLLRGAAGATARASEEVGLAQSATEAAQGDLKAAETETQAQQTVVNGLMHGLDNLLPRTSRDELKKQIAHLLDVKDEVKTIEKLRDVAEEARSLAGLSRAIWNSIWKQPGRNWRLAWVGSTLVIVPLVSFYASEYIPIIRDRINASGGIAAAFGGLSTFVVWAAGFVAKARVGLGKLKHWTTQAERAQGEQLEHGLVKDAKIRVEAALKSEEAARTRLLEAQIHEKQLREQAKNLAPERRLGRYIEERAQSRDYSGQLGLVSLARRDFETLSNLFADAKALDYNVRKLRASGDKEKANQADELTQLSKSIDRIVLFVDDLDRCKPDRVVEVLQAVHLLLAFPLFAVIVGVDQRCLRQSLQLEFKGLVKADRETNNGTQDLDLDEIPATPLDYLEKIFHVPFHLPQMSAKGYEKLVDQLIVPINAGSAKQKEPQPPTKESAGGGTIPPPKQDSGKKQESSDIEKDTHAEPKDKSAIGAVGTAVATAVATAPVKAVGSVPLQGWELQALKEYYHLIRTPRAATRLFNTYRLVRAAVPEKEWEQFKGNGKDKGEFRIAMLLLACAAGFPAIVRDWFDTLRSSANYPIEDNRFPLEAAATEKFQSLYRNAFDLPQTSSTDLPALRAKWLDQVERYTF